MNNDKHRAQTATDLWLQKIAEHVLTMLVNLSADPEVLDNLAKDEKFIDVILDHIVVCFTTNLPRLLSLSRIN